MEIRILVAGEQIGPYSETEVRQYLGQGLVSPSDLAVKEGMAEWQPLESLLADLPPGEAHVHVPMLDEVENTTVSPAPIHVEMYPEPPAATTEEIRPDVPPTDYASPTAEHLARSGAETPMPEAPAEVISHAASLVTPMESPSVPPEGTVPSLPSVEPVAIVPEAIAPSSPEPPRLPAEPISTMLKETNLEENSPAPAETARPLTATQKTKRNKIVIQPILPLGSSAVPVVPTAPSSGQKKLKTGRTALNIEPPRPTTALPPVAGFVPKSKEKDKEPDKKPGRQVVTGPVSMGDLFDKAVAASVSPAQPPALPVSKANPQPAKPTAPPARPSQVSNLVSASAPTTSSVPALEAPKSPKPPVLPTLTAVLSKADFPSSNSNKGWSKGFPNYVIYAGFTAAVLFACLVAFVVFLLMSGHDNGPAPNPTGTAPPPEHASAAPAASTVPQTAADFTARGLAREKGGDLTGALADYDKSLDLDPKSIKTHYQRALLCQTKGDWNGAMSDYNTILSLDPKNADAFSNRGFVKQAQGDADGALADYHQALLLNPKISAAYYNTGLIKVQKGDLDGAIADYNQALALNPGMAIAFYNRGNAKNTEGNLDGAIADYTQALALDPTIALAYCNRGFARQTKGDLDGALADYTQAVGINSKMAVAYYNRGLIRVQKDDLPGAIEDSSRAIELDPKNAQAYCNRGLASMGKGDLDGAMNDLRKFCDLSPRDSGADAARLYLWILAMKQNPKGTADPDLSTALQNDWNSPPEDLTSKIGGFLLGHIREKDLIANAASPDPNREPGQYCKAWYFVGIKRLLNGDRANATTDFQRCVATNQSTFCEYIFAKSELASLTAARNPSAQAAAGH